MRPHGNRHGKTEEQRDFHIAHNLRKRCIKRNFEGIHDRFLKDPVLRESQLEHDRTEEVCIQMDKDAQKDFTYRMTEDEYFRYKKNWWIPLNTSGKIGPMRDRSDFNDALTKLHRLHRESGVQQLIQCCSGKINDDTNHRVLPPAGGNGAIPGGAHDNYYESPQLSSRAKRHDRTVRPVVCRLFTKSQTCQLSSFFFF